MSVLIFAPPQANALVNVNSELAALTRCFHRPLLAHDEIELQRAIAESGEEIEGFWFAGHAGANGIAVGDTIMPPATIAQYLSTAGVDWAFFNSCESAKFVGLLQSFYACDVFASITEIEDVTAWRVASLVALKFSSTNDIYVSVRVAAPSGTTSLQPFPRPISDRVSMPQKDLDQVEQLSEQLRELNRVLTGDKRYRERGLIESVQHLEEQYAALTNQYATLTNQLNRQLDNQRIWQRINGFALLLVAGLELWARFGR